MLNELIAIALAENKDVKIAAARVDQFLGQFADDALAAVPAGRRRLRCAAPARSPLGSTPLPAGVGPVFNQFQATLSASWEIDVFGKLRRQTEAARANLLASEEGPARDDPDAGGVGGVVVHQSASASTGNSRSRRPRPRAAPIRCKCSALRFEGGEVSQMELAQSQSEYEASLATIPQIETQIAQQEDALSVLLGRNPRADRARPRTRRTRAAAGAGRACRRNCSTRRPDLRQAEQNLIAANALIGAARALYFPSISLTGPVRHGEQPVLESLHRAGARLVVRGRGDACRSSRRATSPARCSRPRRSSNRRCFAYQKAIQVAFQEVDDALIALQKSREQLVVQGRQVDALRTYARLARLRYEGGYTSYIEVLDAERSLFNAQLSYTQTQGTVFTSLVDALQGDGRRLGRRRRAHDRDDVRRERRPVRRSGRAGAAAPARRGARRVASMNDARADRLPRMRPAAARDGRCRAAASLRCRRCGAELYRNRPDSLDRALALHARARSCCSLIANAFPIVGLSVNGDLVQTTCSARCACCIATACGRSPGSCSSRRS